MSCLVPSRARAKFNLSRSRSGRSRSLGERLFLVLVVPRSRSFLSLKLSFLVPGRSGSLVIEVVLVPWTISNYSVLEQVCAMDWTLISQKFRKWTNSEQNEQLILSEERTDHIRFERTSIMRTFWRQNFWKEELCSIRFPIPKTSRTPNFGHFLKIVILPRLIL